jgi:hypothetical protein
MALQSVAWARMLADFSRKDSLAVAVKKTFDGQHGCSMCRKIENKQRARETEKEPSPEPLRLPEAIANHGAAAPAYPDFHWRVPPFAPVPYPDFVVAPPRPVPRGV